MIRLAVITGSDSAISHSFDQPIVSIGSGTSPMTDLVLPGELLKEKHIQIVFENSHFYAVNAANDPFASINDKPFGRKALNDNDIIRVGSTQIRFENALDIEALLSQVEQMADHDDFIHHEKAEPVPDPAPSLQTPASEQHLLPAASTPLSDQPPPTPPKQSLKDYYLSEYDDIGEANFQPSQNQQSQGPDKPALNNHWRIYIKIFSALLAILTICAGLAYLWISDQSDKEEISAAKGVADVAMALTYAQLKEIQPQNHNWSDPEFIKNNLTAVLAPAYTTLANFDNHGHFSNCPYLLRIYTSGDLTQFWVIAQPAPSLLQWLIPKSTIILDSRTMEMRKIKDLKLLNRLLVNVSTLDSTNGTEVSNLIRQGAMIPLANLVTKNENLGFSPPKALALIRPGAENLVYNSPRYFLLGEELMKKALDLIEKPASSHEVAMLQQELSSLSKFPNAVFYSSGGIQSAIQGQKALATLSPKEKFLIAYLQFNAHSQVANSHLLMDDTPTDPIAAETGKNLTWRGAHLTQILSNEDDPTTQHQIALGLSTDVGSLPDTPQIDIDEDNPLFLQLSALNVFRQQALRSISDEMISLLNKETQCAQTTFYSRFPQLLAKYLEVSKEQQAKIQKKLDAIYKENTHLPASEFLTFAKVAGLQESLREYLSTLKQQMRTPEFSQEQIEKKLKKIEKAANWQELEQELAETVEILNLERIPDEEHLIAYQNATHSRVIQKLNQFLLSSDHPLPPHAFDAEYRYTLIHVLKMGWITDPDTYDFYLSEFELRTAMPRSQQEDQERMD